jgi:predicted nucleic acid-binding Zn ribbon protein
MDKIGSPLRDLLDRLHLSGPMLGWQAVEVWPGVVGERIAARARAVAYRDGTLFVEVDSPTWMSELGYLKHHMVTELNRRLGGEIIREIRMQPGSGHRPATPRPRGE